MIMNNKISKTMKKIALTIIMAVIVAFGASAQNEKLAQYSFFYPVGTSGIQSINNSYKLSLNTLWGVNGGVNGFELGSIANINRGDVTGGQVSGVVNFTTQNSNGAIVGGVLNCSLGSLDGAAFAGVVNFAGDSSTGGHIAGVGNFVFGKMEGTMISGVINAADDLKGGQISTINLSAGKAKGAQIGVINVANNLKGLQLGVINVSNDGDSLLPVGVINVVRNGYYALELTTSEILSADLTFKMGVEKFHSMFRIGAGRFNNKNYFSTGYGIGSIIHVTSKQAFNVEAICDQIVYDNNWDNNLNLLTHLNLNYQYNITDFLAVKAWPSVKTYITNQKVEGLFNTIDVPYTIVEHTGDNVKTSLWIGINAGITLSL